MVSFMRVLFVIKGVLSCYVSFSFFSQFLSQATQDELTRIKSSTLGKKKNRDVAAPIINVTEKLSDAKVLLFSVTCLPNLFLVKQHKKCILFLLPFYMFI